MRRRTALAEETAEADFRLTFNQSRPANNFEWDRVRSDDEWRDVLPISAVLPDPMLAEAYGTSSLGRARRLISYMEEQGIIVSRTDLGGERSISLPHLGWTTAAAFADPEQPSRLARPARRRQAR